MASWLLVAVVVAATLLLVRRLRRGEAVAWGLAAYAAAFIAAYSVSDFRLDFYNTLSGMGSRYAMPFWATLAGILGLAAGEFAARRSPRVAWTFTAVALVPGLVGFVALLDLSTAWREPPAHGHRFATFDDHFQYASEGDLARHLEWVERLDPDWKGTHALAYRSLGSVKNPRRRWKDPADLAANFERLRAQGQEFAPFLLVDLGRRAVLQADLRGRFAALQNMEGGPNEDELTWFMRGAGMALVPEMLMLRLGDAARARRAPGAPGAKRNMLVFQYLGALPQSMRPAFVEGLGFFVGLNLTPYQRTMVDLIEDLQSIPAGLQRAAFHAMGQGYRRRFQEAAYWVPAEGALEVEQLMNEFARAQFRAGLAAARGEFVRV